MNSANAITVSQAGLIDQFRADRLNIYIYESRTAMSVAAARAVAAELRRLITARGRAIAIFAAAPSQKDLLTALVAAAGIEWTRVIGFHFGEYLGLDEDAPQSCRRGLLERLVKQVPMAEFHGLRGEAANPEAVCANYTALLRSRPPDFAALNIEENGQLGFIAAPVCDFADQSAVRVVEWDEVRALALTIPTMMACPRLFVSAAGAHQREAMCAALTGEITPACPASILRTHPDAHLFLDQDAAASVRRLT